MNTPEKIRGNSNRGRRKMWRYVRGMKIRRYVSLYIAGYSRDILIHWTFLGVHVLVLRTGIRIVKLGGASERASTRSRPRMHENHQDWQDDDR